MSKAPRTIQTPGAPAPAAESTAEGAAPAAAAVGDDLDQFDSDDLPEAEAPNAQELQMALAQALQQNKQLAAQNARFEARFAALEGKKAAKAAQGDGDVMTMAEAKKLAEQDIEKGKRPRSRMTPEGWYVHPEAARVKVAGA